MSQLMHASAVKARNALTDAMSALAARRERGADALEYVGMVVLAALIVGAIVGVVNQETIGNAMRDAVGQILGNTP